MKMIKSTVFKSMQKLQRTANPVNNFLESLEWEGHIPFRVGMPNINQNCYVNASLQAFLAMPPFVSTMKMIGREYGYMIAHSPYMEPLQNMLDILAYAYSSDGRSYNNAINRFLENLYISKSFGFRTIRNRQEDSKDFINSLNDYLDKMMTILNAISQNLDAPTESKKCLISVVFDAQSVSKLLELQSPNELLDTDAESSYEQIKIQFGQGIAGHVALTGESLNISDAYLDSRFNSNIDKITGYRTKSILCLPILNELGECIAVAEAINKTNYDETINTDDASLCFSQEDEETFSKFMPFIAVNIFFYIFKDS